MMLISITHQIVKKTHKPLFPGIIHKIHFHCYRHTGCPSHAGHVRQIAHLLGLGADKNICRRARTTAAHRTLIEGTQFSENRNRTCKMTSEKGRRITELVTETIIFSYV
jgi:hypothetical protein